jgi:hypothetical protein
MRIAEWDFQQLEFAQGIKDSLTKSDFIISLYIDYASINV